MGKTYAQHLRLSDKKESSSLHVAAIQVVIKRLKFSALSNIKIQKHRNNPVPLSDQHNVTYSQA